MKWYFQTVHHGLWDWDNPAPPNLATITVDGKRVDAVAQVTKQGFTYVFDRVSGRPVWPIVERPVPTDSNVPNEKPYPTQPFPTKPPPFARLALTEKDVNPYLPEGEQNAWRERIRGARNGGIFTPPSLKGTLSIPGVGGGASWATAAVDPAKGTLYIVSKDAPTIITLVPPGSPNSDKRGAIPPHPAPIPVDGPFVHYTAPYTQFISQNARLPAISPPWFQMTAYDLNSGTIQWRIPYGSVPSLVAQGHADTGGLQPQRGGPVVTAGGLIFAATNDKKLRAYDEDNGKQLWETTLPAAAEGVPAVYEMGGREYIVICASAGDGPGSYIAFALPR
jgi:quinoprotein glucose dehydrogenase